MIWLRPTGLTKSRSFGRVAMANECSDSIVSFDPGDTNCGSPIS